MTFGRSVLKISKGTFFQKMADSKLTVLLCVKLCHSAIIARANFLKHNTYNVGLLSEIKYLTNGTGTPYYPRWT